MKPSSILKINSIKLNAVRISIIYLALSALWIFLSDKLLELFISDFHTISIIQSIKGFLFVILTTILIYFLIKKNTTLLFLQNNLLEDILDISPVGIVLTNSTGQIIFANKEAETVLGLQKNQITSRSFNDLDWKITDTEGKEFLEKELPFIKVKNTLKSVKDIQHAIEYPDGRRTILSINASPHFRKNNFDGIVASIQDITEKKHFEKSILEKNKFISAITNTIPAIIYIYDFNLQGNIYTNNGIERLLGYTPEEIKQMGANLFSILIHPDDLREFNESHSKILTASDQEVLSFENRFKHKKGNWINFQVLEKTFLRGDDGIVKQKIGIAIDITQRIHVEEELKISNEKLRELTHHFHTVREEEKEAIARDIHDDFGQVLTSLKMNLAFLKRTLSNYGILKEKPNIEKEFDSMFRIIDSSVIKLRKLITNLRPEVLDKLGLIPALEWQVDEFKNYFHIDCTFDSTTNDLILDKTSQITLFRILQESLNNIAKHSKATEVKVTFTENDLFYKLEINDNGIGFEKATLAKDSFGLIGMQERVNLIKGILDIDSKPGKGTKVTVCIPKHKSEFT